MQIPMYDKQQLDILSLQYASLACPFSCAHPLPLPTLNPPALAQSLVLDVGRPSPHLTSPPCGTPPLPPFPHPLPQSLMFDVGRPWARRLILRLCYCRNTEGTRGLFRAMSMRAMQWHLNRSGSLQLLQFAAARAACCSCCSSCSLLQLLQLF